MGGPDKWDKLPGPKIQYHVHPITVVQNFVWDPDQGALGLILANGVPIPVSAEEADSVRAIIFKNVFYFFNKFFIMSLNPGCNFA